MFQFQRINKMFYLFPVVGSAQWRNQKQLGSGFLIQNILRKTWQAFSFFFLTSKKMKVFITKRLLVHSKTAFVGNVALRNEPWLGRSPGGPPGSVDRKLGLETGSSGQKQEVQVRNRKFRLESKKFRLKKKEVQVRKQEIQVKKERSSD